MKTKLLIGLTLVAVLGMRHDVGAQESVERVLVPIWNRNPVPGAFGSRWATEIAIVNAGSTPAQINGWDTQCFLGLCPPTPATPPGVTFKPNLAVFTTEVQGFFLEVDRPAAPFVHFSLRVRDLSRDSENWGTEIPVVRGAEFFADTPLQLLDIPLRSEFRHMLRIYDLDPRLGPARARIRVYETDANRKTPVDGSVPGPQDVLLLEFQSDFRYATTGGGTAQHPGYMEVGDLHLRPELAGATTIRIAVDMLTSGHRFWAFAATTNNVTQKVTIVSPQ